MPQKLHIIGAGSVEVDRIFRNDGAPAMVANVGGVKTLWNEGQPPMIQVAQRGKAFFHLDKHLTPVKSLEDIAVIPASSPHRKAAEAFVELQQHDGKKAEKVLKTSKAVRPRTLIRRHLKMSQVTPASKDIVLTPDV